MMLPAVMAAAAISQPTFIERSASTTSRGCTWRSACQVSATTTAMMITGRKRDAWPIVQTIAVFSRDEARRAPPFTAVGRARAGG